MISTDTRLEYTVPIPLINYRCKLLTWPLRNMCTAEEVGEESHKEAKKLCGNI